MATYLVFKVAGERYGIPVEGVDAVHPMVWVTPVAECPPDVCGVITVRGRSMAVLDPAVRLDRDVRPPSAVDYLILARWAGGRVALKVDEVEGVASGTPEPSPEHVAPPPFVLGYLMESSEPTAVLDVDALLRPETRSTLERLESEDGEARPE